MLKSLFTKKQILIRQNGEVNYLSLPSWMQLFLFSTAIIICAIAATGSYQYIELNKVINEQHVIIEKKQHELDALHLSYQEKQDKLARELNEINDKSQLLSNMLESLPESERAQFASADQTNTIEEEKDTLEKPNKVEQAREENKKASEQETTAVNKAGQVKQEQAPEANEKTSKKETKTPLQTRLLGQKLMLERQFDVLDNIVKARTDTLLATIKKAGIDHNSLLEQTENNHAQGGPFNGVTTDYLTEEQQVLLDKVVLLNTLNGQLASLPTMLPAKHFYVSSAYGLRTDPISKRKAMHRGIDMAGPRNTKIFAAASGKVKRAGRNGGFGNFIEIEHANGFVTRYGHLEKLSVKRGQVVAKDQLIGFMGSSGRSTSTHLHYEILHNGKYINPLKLTKAFENVF